MAAKKKPSKKKVAKKRATKKPWKPTAKQARFIEEYPVDFNATKAAERAKYSKKTAYSMGHELLKKPEIQAAIQKRVGKLTHEAEVTVQRVLNELVKVGFSNLRDYVKVTSDGDPYIDLSEMTEDQAAALHEITVEDFRDGRGDDSREVRRIKIKTLDKLSALDKLGKYLNMFVDQVHHTGELDIKRIERVIVDPEGGKAKD